MRELHYTNTPTASDLTDKSWAVHKVDSFLLSLDCRVKAKKGVNLLQTKSKNSQWTVDWEVQSGAKHSITTIDVNKNKGVQAG
jgi:hypothetical protein